MRQQSGFAGIIGAGGSGGTAMVTPAMRVLPVGVPKVMISTVASGDVQKYVGPADIMMLHSVADVQGLNSITREVLANGASALAGMVRARRDKRGAEPSSASGRLPPVGLTMFGVTTSCVQQVVKALEADYDCLVFHATGIGGQSMEKLVESGLLAGVLDLTTTEICDLLFGGVLPARPERLDAIARTRLPYVGSVGALDMVNFREPETMPQHYAGRRIDKHNPNVTLMRTTPEECRAIGRWLGEKLNACDGPVRFLIPERGVSALDIEGGAFFDPEADSALFDTIAATVRWGQNRKLLRLPVHINDPEFADAVVAAFREIAK
jgi:uncharacterized protein (UPF0261 family)